MSVSPDVSTLVAYLSQIAYFQILKPNDLEEIARQAIYYSFTPDEIIFLQEDLSRGLWVVESGNVKISKFSPEGDELILHLLGPGNSFNDVAALDGGPTPANATAMSLVTCWLLPSEALMQMMERHPKMALQAIRMLSGRVRTLTQQIETLTLYPVMARLARFLLEQAENPALSGPGITRAAIASHLATTPETISRVLAKMQEVGAIRFDRHRILITDAALLRSIALL
jgi:CRP/FNR family transcriptional regulator